jgi:hypothetical protein
MNCKVRHRKKLEPQKSIHSSIVSCHLTAGIHHKKCIHGQVHPWANVLHSLRWQPNLVGPPWHMLSILDWNMMLQHVTMSRSWTTKNNVWWPESECFLLKGKCHEWPVWNNGYILYLSKGLGYKGIYTYVKTHLLWI